MIDRELPTPAVVVDLEVMEHNLARMADYCRQYGLKLRPHTKTHKTPEVARLQMASGASGITVAKVGEAEVMAAAGLDDILVAYPVFGTENLARLARLAESRRLLISLDSLVTAQELSRAVSARGTSIGVLVEFDAGLHRCGIAPGPELVQAAQAIQALPGLTLRGLMTYTGNIWGEEPARLAEAARVAAQVTEARRVFQQAGLPLGIVSGGSTPSAYLSHLIPGLTEIRPGTYVYNDLNTYFQGACALADCAVRVFTTVISTAVPGRAMLDAGSKTLSSDGLNSGPMSGHGMITEAPDARLFKLNEEHGHVDTTGSSHRFYVGEVVSVIPNHVCTCINMHDEVFFARNHEVLGSWRVAARGKVR